MPCGVMSGFISKRVRNTWSQAPFFNRAAFDVRNMSGAHLALYLHGLQRIEFTR